MVSNAIFSQGFAFKSEMLFMGVSNVQLSPCMLSNVQLSPGLVSNVKLSHQVHLNFGWLRAAFSVAMHLKIYLGQKSKDESG